MLRRKNARRLRVLESRRAEEIALDRARSGAPIFPDATERQSAPTELTVAGGPRVRILLAPAESPANNPAAAMMAVIGFSRSLPIGRDGLPNPPRDRAMQLPRTSVGASRH